MIRLTKFLKKYLFRKDIHYKVKERVIYHFRQNFKDPYKDQKHLLGDIDNIIIFDVGAHIGNTVKKYKSVFPNSKIFAFEPSEKPYQRLLDIFKNDKEILISHYALSNNCNIKTLFLSSSNNLNSLKKPNKRAWGFDKKQTIKVETNTINHFCAKNIIKHINILKLDVQGSELDVLEGAKSMLLSQKIDLVYIEWQVVPLYNNHALYYEIGNYMGKFGYELFNIYNINEARSGQIRWGDAIFTSKKLREGMLSEYGTGSGSGW
tara:strand:+ start:48 stop:836 length:789 start_codon:yes stop_codon:yes gene_type:complete